MSAHSAFSVPAEYLVPGDQVICATLPDPAAGVLMVRDVQNIAGTIIIIDFTDGTSTPPVPANMPVWIRA